MSRVSLSRRLAALLEAAEQIDPDAVAVHRLPPATRIRYERWRAACDAVYARYEREGGPGAIYAEYLATSTFPELPEPPRDVVAALGLNDAVQLPGDATAEQLAAMYAAMLD